MDKKEFNKLSKDEKLKVPFEQQPKLSKVPMYIFLGIIAFLMTLCIGGRLLQGPDKVAEKVKGIDTLGLVLKSQHVAERAVKYMLKAPSTAKFPDELQHSWVLDDSIVVVKGAVDAQNSFGAMIRNEYYIKFKWTKDYNVSDNWKVLESELK